MRMPEQRRRATALRYEGTGAPKVAASGRGYIADRIVEVARENGIPVREDPALAEALAALELDTEIPEDLYTAVAEAIAWAYSLDAQAARYAGPFPLLGRAATLSSWTYAAITPSETLAARRRRAAARSAEVVR